MKTATLEELLHSEDEEEADATPKKAGGKSKTTPADGYRFMQLGETPVQGIFKSAGSDLTSQQFPRYYMMAGPITPNSLPPFNAHIDDATMVDLMEHAALNGVAQSVLCLYWPQTFNNRSYPHPNCELFGVPAVRQNPVTKKWHYVIVYNIYIAWGGAEFRAKSFYMNPTSKFKTFTDLYKSDEKPELLTLGILADFTNVD